MSKLSLLVLLAFIALFNQDLTNAQVTDLNTLCHIDLRMYEALNIIYANTKANYGTTVLNDMKSFLSTHNTSNRNYLSAIYTNIGSTSWFINNQTAVFGTSSLASSLTALFKPSASVYTNCDFYNGMVKLYAQLPTPEFRTWINTLAEYVKSTISTYWYQTFYRSSLSSLRTKISTIPAYCDAFKLLSSYAGITHTCAANLYTTTTAPAPTSNYEFTYDNLCNYHTRMQAIQNSFPSDITDNVTEWFTSYSDNLKTQITDQFTALTTKYVRQINRCTRGLGANTCPALQTEFETINSQYTSQTGIIDMCAYYSSLSTELAKTKWVGQPKNTFSFILNEFGVNIASNLPTIWQGIFDTYNSTTQYALNTADCCCSQKALVNVVGLSTTYNLNCSPQTCTI